MDKNNALDKLKKEIRIAREQKRKSVQLVLGTGITIYLTNNFDLSWIKILDSGLEEVQRLFYPENADNKIVIKEINSYRVALKEGNISVDKLLEIADFVCNEFTNEGKWPESVQYQDWLEQTCGSLKIDEDKIDILESLQFAIDCNAKLITTNYDRLISKNLNKCIALDVSQIGQFEKFKSVILHIHGLFDKPKGIILGKKSYDSYFQVNNEYKERLLQLFNPNENINIFIGCGAGLNDPNFEVFLKESYELAVSRADGKDHRTYILVQRQEEKSLRSSFSSHRLKHNYQFITFDAFEQLPYIIREIFDYPDPLNVFKPLFDKLYQGLKDIKDDSQMLYLASDTLLEFNKLFYLGSRVANFANVMRLIRYALFSDIYNDSNFKDNSKSEEIVKDFLRAYNIEKNRNGIHNENLIQPYFKFKENATFEIVIGNAKNNFAYLYPGMKGDIEKYALKKKKFSKMKSSNIINEMFDKLIDSYARMMQAFTNLDNLMSKSPHGEYDPIYDLQIIRVVINDLTIFSIKFNKYLIKLNYVFI